MTSDRILPPEVSTPSAGVPDPDAARAAGLEGRIGVIELVLTVLAWSAPVVVVSAVTPLIVRFGHSGAPLAYLVGMAILLLFSVGYTTMTRYLPNPGAFYAYITAGLGRMLGLGASFLAITGYLLAAIGTYCLLGVTMASLVETMLQGPAIPWYVFSLGGAVLTGVLGYFRIGLSAKVLAVAMICEILIVAIFDAAVLADGGPEGRTLTPFTWEALTSGSVGLAVLFAASCFGGFEATAIFREETKDPRRTVTRATYLAVASIGVFYIIATWLVVVAYGPGRAVDAANSDPVGMFPSVMESFVGVWARDVVTVLVATSTFAAVLAVQNILARYCYSLGVDRVLPAPLGAVHPRHRSPHISSLTVSTIIIVAIVALAVAAIDPPAMYAQLVGAGGFALMFLMALTSVAVVVFFRRRRDITDSTWWHTLVAPILSVLGMGTVLYLAITNFTTMTGGSTSQAVILQLLIWAAFATGVVLALVYRSKRPSVYARIGRQKVG